MQAFDSCIRLLWELRETCGEVRDAKLQSVLWTIATLHDVNAGFPGPLQLGGELLGEVYAKVAPLRLTDRRSVEQSLPRAAS